MSEEIVAQTFRNIPIALLREAAQNPRQHFDPKKLEELTASIKAHGVRTPLLVRPNANEHEGYEIGAGHRRYRAALAAGLAEVPAVIRPMGDTEFLELLTFENLQREDVHPLEEAEGYRALIRSKGGYDVAKIGERVGKSASYVYDRLKLLELTPPAQKLFRDGKLTAGHAILLARLSPADQARAIGKPGHGGSPLFEYENALWTPEEARGTEENLKPISVRELQAWIDENVRFDPATVEPLLFPETALTLAAVQEKAEKIVAITHEGGVGGVAKGEKTYSPWEWKRADGAHGSKVCEEAVTGVVVIGPGRGRAFKVCIAKERCKKHWAEEIRNREQQNTKRLKDHGAAATSVVDDSYKRAAAKQRAEEARLKEKRARWTQALPAIVEAVAAKVKKATAAADGHLGTYLLSAFAVGDFYIEPVAIKAASRLVPRGKTAEDLVRHLAFLFLYVEAADEYSGPAEFPRTAKGFGVDVAKILAAAAPETPAAPASAKKAKASKA
jgi:ParB/RepB/Spo0J family partition protein